MKKEELELLTTVFKNIFLCIVSLVGYHYGSKYASFYLRFIKDETYVDLFWKYITISIVSFMISYVTYAICINVFEYPMIIMALVVSCFVSRSYYLHMLVTTTRIYVE